MTSRRFYHTCNVGIWTALVVMFLSLPSFLCFLGTQRDRQEPPTQETINTPPHDHQQWLDPSPAILRG